MSLSVNQSYNVNSYKQNDGVKSAPKYYSCSLNTPACDTFVKNNTCEKQGVLNKIVSFGKSLAEIMKIITPQKPNTTFEEDKKLPYFEYDPNETYISAAVEEQPEQVQTPQPEQTKAEQQKPVTEEDLTKAKLALKKSYLAENVVQTRLKEKFRRKL